MVKKRTKKSYKKYRKNGKQNEQMFFAIVLIILILYYYSIKYIKPNLEIIVTYLLYTLFSLIIISIPIIYYKTKKKKEVIICENELLNDLVNEINTFKPLRKYNQEMPYQIELSGFLKKTYKGLKIEETKGNARPDIIVENIAIEIKGPTNPKDLGTIADKIIKYFKYYDFMIVVLFSIEIQEKDYLMWKTGILEHFDKYDGKLFIIEIN
ncbi:MAG: hypothetical protein V3575_00010 [Candidatus Absconditabacteria bacterium]